MGRHLRKEFLQNGSQSRGYMAGFTLAELLVSMGVLVLLVFLATQLLNTAANLTTLGHKKMDADSQARQFLDRMAVDFAQMVKRSDVDYYVKSNPVGIVAGLRTVLQPGNDQIAFYSSVPGYYPSGSTSTQQSPLSLVAYRVNSDSSSSSYTKVERMGKGLVWNAVSTTDTPVVFMPIPVASPLPSAELPVPPPNPLPAPAWPQAGNMTADAAYEVVGPQVFRFEYYYLLKDGTFSDCPMISPHTSLSGMQDVSAIVVDIAVIDPKSKVILGPTANAQIASLAAQLVDFSSGHGAGWLRTQWQNTLNTNTTLPRPAISGVRLYERFIYLSPPTL